MANDQQGPKPEERKPLFTSEELCKAVANGRDKLPYAEFAAIGVVMKMVEAKITSGELMVVKTATIETDAMGLKCSSCHRYYSHGDQPSNGQFCRCGCKIVEP